MKGKRKKLMALFLCVVFIAALTACAGKNGGTAYSGEPAVQSEADAEIPNSETSETGSRQESSLSGENEAGENTEESGTEVSNSNILIAYFTWAENTHVENPEAVDVDATTSASVLPPGNTAKMANWIRERVGGDLFSIVVTEPYSDNYDECLDRAADEKAENTRPELVNHVENMQEYDVIFLGFPNWWYTAPMAIFSFIEEYDFSGKTIIPFCAHGTGGLAGSVKDITDALPDSAEVLEPVGVYRPDVDSAQPAINDWLDSLGYTEGCMSGTILVEKAEGYVTEDMPLILIQHGNADTICPIDQSCRIYQRMIETAGEDRAEFDILDGAEHGDADFETAENMERIVRFLKQCGL